MSTVSEQLAPAPARAGWGRRLTVAFLLILVLCAASLAACLDLSSEAEALRDGLTKPNPAFLERQIEIGAGSFPLFVARLILGFVDVEPEIRTAAAAVRGVQVGLYAVKESEAGGSCDSVSMLQCADEAMAKRGWYRMAGAAHGHELVAVYLPEEIRSPSNVKVCVAVLERDQLVIVRARGNLEPLLAWAQSQPGWVEKERLWSAR